MGLFNRKSKKETPKKKATEMDKELTEEELDKVCGHTPNSDWCPRVNVEPISLNGKQNNGRVGQNRKDLGR